MAESTSTHRMPAGVIDTSQRHQPNAVNVAQRTDLISGRSDESPGSLPDTPASIGNVVQASAMVSTLRGNDGVLGAAFAKLTPAGIGCVLAPSAMVSTLRGNDDSRQIGPPP